MTVRINAARLSCVALSLAVAAEAQDLSVAKQEITKAFQSALPPGRPDPTLFTCADRLSLPISNLGVISNGAYTVAQGRFKPGKIPAWLVTDSFPTAYRQMVQNMAYGTSQEDRNTITTLTTKNSDVLNALVGTYERTYSRITDAQMQAAGVATKIDYFLAKVPELKKSLNWGRFAADYNSASADIDILSNLNADKVEFAKQINAIKEHLKSPDATNGGTQSFDTNNNKVWSPGYAFDPNFPKILGNGQTVKIEIEMKNVGTSSSSFSINGTAAGVFDLGFLGIGGSSSAEMQQADFRRLMSDVKITLEYDHVAFLQVAPVHLSTNETTGWYLADILREAYHNTSDSTGPFFATNSKSMKASLANGEMQALTSLLVSEAAKGTMEFATDDYSSFQKYFHTEAHASVSLFGIIPIASSNTSYTKSSSGASDKRFKMVVKLNPAGDQNNLVVHGGTLENPIQHGAMAVEASAQRQR